MRSTHRLGLLTALAVVTWALLSALGTGSASASSPQGSFCSGGGVNVVVDFHQLGGGVHRACDPDGAGQVASKVFTDAGFDLTPVTGSPAVICKVADKPADSSCGKMPSADAYWSLYVGKSGKWGYATKGATQLKLHDGDFVAFSWQHGKKTAMPGVAPVITPQSTASPSADAASAPQETQATHQGSQDSGGGLAWWIPVVIVVVLALLALGMVTQRRRSSASS